MDVSREIQRSTNISEVEEYAEVRNTTSRSFLLSIGYFAFVISFTSFTVSKFRKQTHAIVKAPARPVESKVLQEVILVEERVDSILKLVGAENLQEYLQETLKCL